MLRDLTSGEAVLKAIAEFDRLGRDEFLSRHDFGRARSYFLRYDGRLYDSKAIAGVAHGYQWPDRGPLRAEEFSGGEATVRRQLVEELGFEVVGPGIPSALRPERLEAGSAYSWDQLATAFGFKPNYLSVAGGMPVSSATNSVLLITHPGGAKSFDYGDYWDGADLIYTGRGKVGDQQRVGANLDVAENRRPLFVFEAAGPRQLLFLGRGRCVEERTGRAPDDNGEMRTVLQFRLRFPPGEGHQHSHEPRAPRGERSVERQPRPFDPNTPPPSRSQASATADPAETAAKQEKANHTHHVLLSALAQALEVLDWQRIEEIPAAIDLRAQSPDSLRFIFEVKTLTHRNELSQTRAGFAQLCEYRLEYGRPDDELCLVVDRPLAARRQRLLDSLEVAVLVRGEQGFGAGNDRGSRLAAALDG